MDEGALDTGHLTGKGTANMNFCPRSSGNLELMRDKRRFLL